MALLKKKSKANTNLQSEEKETNENSLVYFSFPSKQVVDRH